MAQGEDDLKTILIVDDDVEVRTMMWRTLRSAGFKVLQAADGLIALSIATRKIPDLIISDVMMDNLNGFMLCDLLRKEPRTANIPIFLITGEAQRAGAWQSEMNVKYFQKPVAVRDLLAAVDQELASAPPQ